MNVKYLFISSQSLTFSQFISIRPISLGVLSLLLFSRSGMSDYFATPWTVAHQALFSMEFPRQEYWSRLPFSSPGDLPHSGIEPGSPSKPTGKMPGNPVMLLECTTILKLTCDDFYFLTFAVQ